MTTVQLNARIDGELKASGDAALAIIGLSPSQAVRALWQKASLRGKDLEEVAELLAPSKQTRRADAEEDLADASVRRGWDYMDAAYASLGIDASTVRDYPADELLEDALQERLAEMGLA